MSPEGIARFRAALDRGGEDQPVQLFDNLYMFGTRSVNSLVLRTSGGLIMWDALNNEQDARTIIEPGMRKFGLDPADIRLLIVTHAHGDHFGGAKYFQDRYKVPVASSDIDWAAMERARGSVPPPVRNRVLSDGEKVTVGDATVRMVLTPGHTPGALSSLLPVKDNGVTRVMALWGATTLPGNSAALRQYGDSLQHFSEAAKEASAAGYLNTHAAVWKIAEQRAAAIDGGPNPLAIGEERLQKLLEIKRECVEAAKAWWTAMGR
jgi:metallo-beta-lactamase class B